MKRAAPIVASLLLASAALAEPQDHGPEDWPSPVMGGHPYGMLLANRLEAGFGDTDSYAWDVEGWYGQDLARWRFETEGEGAQGESLGHAEVQVLYSRLFSPFWEWQVGVRHDFRPLPARSHVVAGVRGTAPYQVDVDAALAASEEGDLTARLEAEYELYLTDRLRLAPRVELDLALGEDRAAGVGRGLGRTETGVRLHYEIRRELAPYLGVSWTRRHGDTADLATGQGEEPSVTTVVIGIRAWF
jgi:copper resistance protein B